MLFRELKPGYPVYGLFKDEDLRVTTGKVVNISQPHFENMNFNSANPAQSGGQLVVDATIELEGSTKTYSIPENSSFVYAGNLALATDKDSIVKELEVVKSQSEEALSKVDFHEARVKKCTEILSSWSPSFKANEANEKRFSAIEGDVKGMKESLSELKGDIKELLKKLS